MLLSENKEKENTMTNALSPIAPPTSINTMAADIARGEYAHAEWLGCMITSEEAIALGWREVVFVLTARAMEAVEAMREGAQRAGCPLTFSEAVSLVKDDV